LPEKPLNVLDCYNLPRSPTPLLYLAGDGLRPAVPETSEGLPGGVCPVYKSINTASSIFCNPQIRTNFSPSGVHFQPTYPREDVVTINPTRGGDCRRHAFIEDRNGKPVARQGRKAMSLVNKSRVHSQESLTPDWRLKTDRLDCLATEAS
jgi:hypothetical protein